MCIIEKSCWFIFFAVVWRQQCIFDDENILPINLTLFSFHVKSMRAGMNWIISYAAIFYWRWSFSSYQNCPRYMADDKDGDNVEDHSGQVHLTWWERCFTPLRKVLLTPKLFSIFDIKSFLTMTSTPSSWMKWEPGENKLINIRNRFRPIFYFLRCWHWRASSRENLQRIFCLTTLVLMPLASSQAENAIQNSNQHNIWVFFKEFSKNVPKMSRLNRLKN